MTRPESPGDATPRLEAFPVLVVVAVQYTQLRTLVYQLAFAYNITGDEMPSFQSNPLNVNPLHRTLQKHPAYFGIPFLLIMVGASYGLQSFTQTRYDLQDQKVHAVRLFNSAALQVGGDCVADAIVGGCR